MDPLEFALEALPELDHYLSLLAMAGALYWFLLLRRRTLGLFDPLFLVLFGNIFGWAIVWFMYLRGDIDVGHVTSFTVSEIAFCTGLYIIGFKRVALGRRAPVSESSELAILVLGLSTALHVGTTLATWIIAGIPLFQVSRLGAFVDSGGLGIIERFVDASAPISLFSALYLLIGNTRTRARFIYYLIIGWHIIAVGLSGSKSALLPVGQCVFAVCFLYTSLGNQKDSFWGGKTGKTFIVVALLFALLVLFLQQADADPYLALLGLGFRLMAFGDIYIFAYPGNLINELQGENPFIGLFGGFLSTFRLFPVESIYPNIGYQFTLLMYPEIDYISGPNPRHPVFGAHYFGMLAFMFSLLLGMLTSWTQRKLYFPKRRTFLSTLTAFTTYSILSNMSVDFDYSMSRLASLIITYVAVVMPAMVLVMGRNWKLIATRISMSSRS